MLNHQEDNVKAIKTLVTRNQEEIQKIENTSFWIADVKQSDGSMKLIVSTSSYSNALKYSQNQSEYCLVLPVDNGVFNEKGLSVSDKSLFIYKWENDEGVSDRNAGDCDALIVKNKWYFIEFKTEMQEGAGNDLTRIARNINNNKRKGYAQLAKSAFSVMEQLKLTNANGICVLAMPNFVNYPKHNASDITMTLKYEKLLNHKFIFKKVTVDSNNNCTLE